MSPFHKSFKKGKFRYNGRDQNKFVQTMYLGLNEKKQNQIQALKVLSRCKSLKKLTLMSFSGFRKEKTPIIILFKRIYKNSKRIKTLKLSLPDDIQQNPKSFKGLLLLSSLESLTISYLRFYQNGQNLRSFIQALKLASKRKSWPSLKSLKVHPLTTSTKYEKGQFAEALTNLSEFMRDLSFIENIYKCTSFQVDLQNRVEFPCEEFEKFWEIILTGPPITSIEIGEAARSVPKLPETHSKNLKSVKLGIHDKLQRGIDLKSWSNLEKLILIIENKEDAEIILYKDLLFEIPTLKNLKDLSLEFQGMQMFHKELTKILPGVLGSLPNLQSLLLSFCKDRERRRDKFTDGAWLGDVFREIGGKLSKLRKLILAFETFESKGSDGLLTILGESLVKLPEISDLHLRIADADSIKEEELLILWQSVGKLTKIENLSLDFSKYNAFSVNLFVELMDCIVNNCPLVLFLCLRFSRIFITERCYEMMVKAVRNLRCLNDFSVMLGVKLMATNLKFEPLVAEIRQRMYGDIRIG